MATIYPEWDPESKLTPNEAQGVVGMLIIVVFLLMSFEIVEPDIAFFIALVIVLGCGILSINEALSGFSNEGMITVGVLFLVVRAVEKSHLVDFVARKAFGTSANKYLGQIRMYLTCFCLSIFVSI
jgi:di/tricarboxylate transporter